jgi:hypothetical protein
MTVLLQNRIDTATESSGSQGRVTRWRSLAPDTRITVEKNALYNSKTTIVAIRPERLEMHKLSRAPRRLGSRIVGKFMPRHESQHMNKSVFLRIIREA